MSSAKLPEINPRLHKIRVFSPIDGREIGSFTPKEWYQTAASGPKRLPVLNTPVRLHYSLLCCGLRCRNLCDG